MAEKSVIIMIHNKKNNKVLRGRTHEEFEIRSHYSITTTHGPDYWLALTDKASSIKPSRHMGTIMAARTALLPCILSKQADY